MRTFVAIGIGWLALGLMLVAGAPDGVFAEDEALPERVPGTVRIAGDPDGLPEFSVVKAYPELVFDRPMFVACPGDGSGRLFVAEQGGVIKVFDNDPAATKTTVALDISKQVSREHNEEGLLGIAFHPDFKKNRHLYLAYSTADPRQTVVERFTASSTRRHVTKGTEKLVLRQRQPTGSHNGGCLAFGPDGFLYISIGDGGEPGDENGHAQNLSSWLGTILRIDVDAGERYAVPKDNPFATVQHVRPEIWAYGFADVRRFSFDSVTGQLWAGDAGAGRFEEIDHVERGGNYGWNLFEGNERFREGSALTPVKAPALAVPRADARRIVGGVVYRGDRLTGLAGAYVYADHETGTVFALRYDGKIKDLKRIGIVPGVTSVTADGRGELLITSLDGSIYTLTPFSGNPDVIPFPQRLSETGLFTDIQTLAPNPAMVPYDIATPLWSDGAGKMRYVLLPGRETITVRKDGTYAFPAGTIFVKHFYIGDDFQTGRMLETRLLVRREEHWDGYTYAWKADRSDAHLIDGRVDATVDVGGTPRTWSFPSRQDCTSCHTAVANEVLGFRREQLDVPFTYGAVTMNQLDALEKIGIFDGKNKRGGTWPEWGTDAKKPDSQVRAYLDSNCAMCHQPGGPGNANIDLRYDTPVKNMNMIDVRPGMWDLDVFNARLIAAGDPQRSILFLRMKRTDLKGMPTIAHNVPDEKALARIEAWIQRLK